MNFSARLLLIFLWIAFGCQRQQEEPIHSQSKEYLLSQYYFQQADSLKKHKNWREALEQNTMALSLSIPDTSKPDILMQRMALQNKMYPRDSAIATAHTMEELAISIMDTNAYMESCYRLSYYYQKLGNNNEALKYGIEGIRKAEEIKDSLKIAKFSLNLGNLLNDLSNYPEAEKVAITALPYTTNDRTKAAFYNILANSSSEQEDYREKIYWLQQAKNLEIKSFDEVILRNNWAMGQWRLGNKQKALDELSELVETTDWKSNDFDNTSASKVLEEKARILANLGLIRMETGMGGALPLYQQAQHIFDSLKSKGNLSWINLRMANYYRNNPSRAMNLGKNALSYAEATGNINEQLNALKFLTEIANDPRTYALRHQKLSDSINKVQLLARNAYARYIFEVNQTREKNQVLLAETELQKTELQRSRLQKISLTIIIFLLLSGSFMGYRLQKTRNLIEKIREVNSTENKIAKRIHDELANDLYKVMVATETSHWEVTSDKEKLLNNLEDLYQRTRKISKDNASIPTGTNFLPALKELLQEFNGNTIRILVKGLHQTTIPVEEDKQICLYRVLQELLVNTMKHSKASLVMIDFKREGKTITIQYHDNGKGADMSAVSKGSGISNTETRIKAIKGSISFESKTGKGFHTQIKIPI
ncbi:tetratricopeptide repeat-containing sensor histidine kinase [Robertkochia solimangrovi]|uniref:tetratricopeptide repeat-containing sensor histidine kinase n=1 Tax=Robertkochia solimangrovi TaxID=2213046 RepID=UPI001180572D|nr:ATP-binding protein [Robertkochia solimangrovi]TRZ46232.1 hypothetical protein DMZ48_02960 [Robertkochia solimangrovi]